MHLQAAAPELIQVKVSRGSFGNDLPHFANGGETAGVVMAADVLVSQELKSLQDELSESRKQRATSAVAAPATAPPADVHDGSAETNEEKQVREQLREFSDELKTILEEAEKTVSAHPAQSVIGAMLVGILIGRLLGKR